MIKASFHRNDDKKIDSLMILGHADSGPYGQDIVCAAVSAVTIGTINNLEKLTKIQPQIVLDEVNGGHLGCRITDAVSHDSVLLLENLYETLLDIADSYPDNIKVMLQKNTIEFN